MSEILDSGARREFETGALRDIDEAKGRCDLLPLDVIADFVGEGGGYNWTLMEIHLFCKSHITQHLYNAAYRFVDEAFNESITTAALELSIHFRDGAEKYGEYNWQKGIPTHCYVDSAVRHYLKWLRGDKDERHDRAFLWNIVCLIWTLENKPEMDDLKKMDECPRCGNSIPKDAEYCSNCDDTIM